MNCENFICTVHLFINIQTMTEHKISIWGPWVYMQVQQVDQF